MASTLGTFIRHRRQRLGLTQAQLAVRVGHGTTQVHVSRLERGVVTLPRWHRLLALAAALEVSPGALLLRAGLITATDLQATAHTAGHSPRVLEVKPRPVICPPVGVIREWQTAAIFTCS